MIKVFVVMTARQTGGAELYVERLARALGERVRFTVAASDAAEMAPLRQRLAGFSNVTKVHALPFDNPSRLFSVTAQIRSLARGHDLVHLNSNHPASRLGILMGFELTGLPWIAVEQRATPVSDVIVPRLLAPVLPAMFRWSRRGAQRVVAVSQENAKVLADTYGLPKDRIVVVYNGAELPPPVDGALAQAALRAELGLPPAAKIVLVLARIHPNKGHRYLVDAAPAIIDAVPTVHFVFAGALDDPFPLQRRIDELGLANRFSLLGFRTGTSELLAASDAFVLPSLGEGFALTILEALAAGLPTVATAVGGAPEIIEEGSNGYLVPAADAPSLAHAVTRALSLNDAEREAMSQAAQASARRFSIDGMADRMEALYRTVKRGQSPG